MKRRRGRSFSTTPPHSIVPGSRVERDDERGKIATRRRFLTLAFLAVLSALLPRRLSGGTPRFPEERRLSLYHIHTRESLKTVFRAGGTYRPEALAAIDRFLRDHRTGTVHPIDPGLLDLLFLLREGVGGKGPIHVICGYRTPASNADLAARTDGIGAKSLHMQGRAVDIRIPGVPLSRLRDTALSLRGGGVGYYPRSGFLHLDTGRARSW